MIKMKMIKWLIFVFGLLCSEIAKVVGVISKSNFMLQSDLAGKTCSGGMLIYTTTAKHALECLSFCSQKAGCNGGCYSQSSRTCYVCLFNTLDANVMMNIGGTVCYTHILCREPPVVSNVVYGQAINIASVGFQLSYSCTPCTYFTPRGTSTSITCQDNLTWTTPVCVNAPTAGIMKSGSPIPTFPLGCLTAFGNQCPINVENVQVQGVWYMETQNQNRGCFCDVHCCYKGDCCYDYGC